MKKLLASLLCLVVIAFDIAAQQNQPTDYLTSSFHAGRRESARKMMPANSVMAVFAYPVRTYSNDVDYTYHPNPDLYYFTGYKEPHAVLFIFKDMQHDKNGNAYNELFFVQKRDPQAEQWTGRRLGDEGVKKELNIAMTYNGEAYAGFPLDFSNFSSIIFDALPPADGKENTPGDLSQLVAIFRKESALPDNYDPEAVSDLVNVSNRETPQNFSRIANYLNRNLASAKYKDSALVKSYLAAKDQEGRKAIVKQLSSNKWNSDLYGTITNALRGIKTPEEMLLIRKAVEISSIGHAEVMKAIHPDMSEREIEGIHDYVQKKYGAEHWGYPPIVGAGNNGCVLHYEENNNMNIGKQTLLMDVGGEYHGYSADVTRTVPANGKFSAEQKTIYNIVYDAQEAAFKLCKEGSTFADIEAAARSIVAKGLVKLGLIKTEEESRLYYPHGLSHHIGMDVHDKGEYDTLRKDMVITIEPGIYIPEGSKCDKKWWGIGVRIEDDLLIKEKDYEILSAAAPRKAEDVEKMVAEKSVFEDMKLPSLKSSEKKKGY
ncbi:MAG: aminopeptidase P N-terminal domain-containing protein [Chitinophagaceae bacterium]